MATYKTPVITPGQLEADLMTSVHAMIAGSAGSGKSVLLRRCMLYAAAKGYHTVLIDPKGAELRPWKGCINTIGYAEYTPEIIALLHECIGIMERRLHGMTKFCRMYEGTQIWIMIDEYADLVTSPRKKEIKTLVQRLAQKGRAAGIHVLLCTQRPTTDVIDGAIKVNITTRCALHCPTAQDSRNILNHNGAEDLPMHGYAYLLRDSGAVDLYQTEMLDDSEEQRVVTYMTDIAHPVKAFFRKIFG